MSESRGHRTMSHGGYEITFHPAFASRCVVQCEGCDEVEVYKQDKPHKLNGEKKPKKHEIAMKGGPNGRDLRISIDDPKHHIYKITLELHPADYDPDLGSESKSVETVTMFNTAQTCPPVCGDR
jgi:hypothetical protein